MLISRNPDSEDEIDGEQGGSYDGCRTYGEEDMEIV